MNKASSQANILFISSRSDLSGGPKAMYNIMFGDKKSNNIFSCAPDNQYFSEKFKNISLKYFPIPYRSFSIFSFIKLIYFCKNNNIQLIHSHGRGAGYYSRLLKPFGFSIIHTLHGFHPPQTLIDSLKNRIDYLFSTLTDHFICTSKSELTTALKFKVLTEKKTTIIPNGIDLNMFIKPSQESIEEFRKKYNLTHDEILLGTLTRLEQHKGNYQLIEHVSKLIHSSSKKEYKLLIAGEGNERENLQKLITSLHLNDKIILIGRTESLNLFLNSIDIFVSCSKGEGLPLSVIEALTANTNCVLSNVSGHKDLVPPENLFSLENAQEFIDKVENSIYPDKFEAKDFSLEKMYNKTKEIYLTSLESTKSE